MNNRIVGLTVTGGIQGFGGHSGEVTPVPIPNTVVKLASANGTWR